MLGTYIHLSAVSAYLHPYSILTNTSKHRTLYQSGVSQPAYVPSKILFVPLFARISFVRWSCNAFQGNFRFSFGKRDRAFLYLILCQRYSARGLGWGEVEGTPRPLWTPLSLGKRDCLPICIFARLPRVEHALTSPRKPVDFLPEFQFYKV